MDLCNTVNLIISLRDYVADLRDDFDNFGGSSTVSLHDKVNTQRCRVNTITDESTELDCEQSGPDNFNTAVFIGVIDSSRTGLVVSVLHEH